MLDETRPIPMISLSPSMQPDNYVVKNKNEIAGSIYNLCKKQIPITVYSGTSEKIHTASLIASIKPEYGIIGLAIQNNNSKNNPFIEEIIICVANHNQAHLQFELKKLSKSDALFTASLPDKIFRLKRRNEERLSLPTNIQVTCTILHSNGKSNVLDLIDISTGGTCMIDFSTEFYFEPDMIINDCKIDLGKSNPINVDLLIRNISAVTLSDGTLAHLLNCSFKQNNTEVYSVIQNFIHGLELTFRKKLDDPIDTK